MAGSAGDFYARWGEDNALAGRTRDALGDCVDRRWELVFRFYGCLHLVEGYLRTKSERFWSHSHVDRDKAMRLSPELKSAYQHYRDLKDLSSSVRYDPGFVATEKDFAMAARCAGVVSSVVATKLKNRLSAAQ